MAGRRLLDAAAIFKASQGVVSKYITLRTHQLETFSKTSSVAKAIKNQTDRVTLTVRAASALNDRFNSSSPQYSIQAQGSRDPSSQAPSIRKDGAGEETFKSGPRNGLEQDHFYTRSEGNTTAQPLPKKNLGVQQETAKRNPLPDGSILPEDSDINKLAQDQIAFSESQHAVPAKEPVVASRPEAELIRKSSGDSTVPRPATLKNPLTPEKARELQRQAESQIPSQSAEPSAPGDLGPGNETADSGLDQGKDVYYTTSSTSGPVFSSLPRVKVPEVTEDAQEANEHIADEAINPDVYYTSRHNGTAHVPLQAQAVPEQDSSSEDTVSEIFQSPKVAKLLSGKQRYAGTLESLELQGPQQLTTNQSKSPEDSDRDSYSTCQAPISNMDTKQERPATEDAPTNDGKGVMHVLAADMAKDNNHNTLKESNVCYIKASHWMSILID